MSQIGSLLKSTWKRTISSKCFRWAFPGSLLGVITFIAKFNNTQILGMTMQWWYALVLIGGIFVLFFLFFLVLELWRLIHYLYVDSIYVSVINYRKELSVLYGCFINRAEISDEDTSDFLIKYCDTIKDLFDRLLNNETSVSIKVIMPCKNNQKGTHDAIVENLCRDSKSSLREPAGYSKTVHTILANTAFSSIINYISRNKTSKFYYYNDDIASSNDYQSSSFDVYGDNGLPYNSEIVVPVFLERKTETLDFGVVGFLCIDSKATNLFKKGLDCEVNLLKSIAADLFTIIVHLNRKKNGEEN